MPTSLPEQLQRRVDQLLRLVDLARRLAPERAEPAFAHMRIRAAGRHSDLLLGQQTRTGGGVAIVDWQRAPVAEAFFACAEGEEYEIEADGRTVTGTLLERNLLGFERGELVEIATPDALLRRLDGAWRAVDYKRGEALPGRPADARRRLSPIDVELDAAQRRVVELPAGRATLVLGEAGCGKTTVALHRLAHLLRERPGARAAVIVPTDGLRRLVVSLLERLGVEAEVWLYDRWAGEQARRAFPDLPRRECEEPSAGVLRVKRHPGLRPLLEEIAKRPPAVADDDPDAHPLDSTAQAVRADLQHLFGDTALLRRLAEADPTVTARQLAETFEHTHVQFGQSAEEEWAHVDADRLAALDGRLLDAGTPDEDAGTVDAEDYAVLFELDRLRAARTVARAAEPRRYDLLVLDEAQEFAPLELALLGRALAPRGTLVVAGDAEQQVDPTAHFAGWPAAMAELGRPGYETSVLDISYRCPPEVTALARRVLDPARDRGEPAGPGLFAVRHRSELHEVAWLVDELRGLRERDPGLPMAVIVRTPEAARRLATLLRRGLALRLALGGDFDLRSGLNVTCVEEVKGLEFDTVLVPDALAGVWPETPQARRALYVAVTRADRQLVLSAAGGLCPLLGTVGVTIAG